MFYSSFSEIFKNKEIKISWKYLQRFPLNVFLIFLQSSCEFSFAKSVVDHLIYYFTFPQLRFSTDFSFLHFSHQNFRSVFHLFLAQSKLSTTEIFHHILKSFFLNPCFQVKSKILLSLPFCLISLLFDLFSQRPQSNWQLLLVDGV